MSETAAPLQELEIKVAFLERANAELSDVVYGQQLALDAFARRLAMLETELVALRETLNRD